MLSRVQGKTENKVDSALLAKSPKPCELVLGNYPCWLSALLREGAVPCSSSLGTGRDPISCHESSPGDGCQPRYPSAAGEAGWSPSGVPQQKAESARATRKGAAFLALSLGTQKRNR